VRRCLEPPVRWQTSLLAERDLSSPVPEVRPRIPVDIRFLSRSEVHHFRPAFESQGLAWTTIDRRLARGDRCAAALSEGGLLNSQWVTFTMAWIPEFQAALCLDPGDVYGYNAVTRPQARGNNLHPAVIAFVMRDARERGCRRHLSYVRADNFSGRHAAAKIPRDRRFAIRRIEFAWLRGVLLIGLDAPGCPRLAFPAPTTTRHLGPIGMWISGGSSEESLGYSLPSPFPGTTPGGGWIR
jgi:ribosomal protein S18 acetylase RimI-like enzyme